MLHDGPAGAPRGTAARRAPADTLPGMVHLRIVSPQRRTEQAMEILMATPSVSSVVKLPGAASKPEGDVILADVAREDASVILSDLKALGLHEDGAISLEEIDMQLSRLSEQAEEYAPGAPSDAVVWEQVEQRTSEQVELSGVFLAFMVLAGLIASVGIFQDSPILIVGAMVVGPEFGPIAGICVAVVQRQAQLARRSALALAAGFPATILATYAATHVFKATGLTPDRFGGADHTLSDIIASPDFFSAFVAVCAGAAGMLSLSTAKSGALIGVLISVTTIPAAANIGVSAAYHDWDSFGGSAGQLGINLASILVAGTTVLMIQRLLYRRRRERHVRAEQRRAGRLARAE